MKASGFNSAVIFIHCFLSFDEVFAILILVIFDYILLCFPAYELNAFLITALELKQSHSRSKRGKHRIDRKNFPLLIRKRTVVVRIVWSSEMMMKMSSAQVVETSVTNNSSFQTFSHPDSHTIRTGVKLLTKRTLVEFLYTNSTSSATKKPRANKTRKHFLFSRL